MHKSTAFMIRTNSKPMAQFSRLLPMSREDENFWRIRRERENGKIKA